jgi:hypothetical protein
MDSSFGKTKVRLKNIGLLAAACLALGGLLMWFRSSGPLPPGEPPAAGSAALGTSSAAAARPAPAPAPEPEPSELHYDCEGLGRPKTSRAPVAAELIALSRSPGASALPCGSWPRSAGWAERAEEALKLADSRLLARLPVPDRIIVQNAALRIAICAEHAEPAARAAAVKTLARKLVSLLAPSEVEIQALAGTAERELGIWLADRRAWRVRQGTTRLHALSEGFTLAHQRMSRARDYVNVARLIAVDRKGHAREVDAIARLAFLRYDEQGVRACIVEASAFDASYAATERLEPVSKEDGNRAIAGNGGPPCWACHAREQGDATTSAARAYTDVDLAELEKKLGSK